MHDPAFWTELLDIVLNRFLPGQLYGVAILPRSEKGPVTLGSHIHLTQNTTEAWLREYLEPLLAKMEEDYDEEFSIDTKIKIRDLGPIEQPIIPSPIKPSKSLNASTQVILQALKESNTLANASMQGLLKGNQQVLKAIQAQAQTPPVNWTPIIQGAISGLGQAFGLTVAPIAVTQDTQPTASPVPAPSVSKLDAINSRIDKLETILSQLSTTTASLSQGFNQLSLTVANLSDGFNTLTKLVAAQGQSGSSDSNTSNGSSSSPSSNGSPGSPMTSGEFKAGPCLVTNLEGNLVDKRQLAAKVEAQTFQPDLPAWQTAKPKYQ